MYIIQKNKIKIQYFSWLKKYKKSSEEKEWSYNNKELYFYTEILYFNLHDLGVKVEKTRVYNWRNSKIC